jgi:hypothetical protein
MTGPGVERMPRTAYPLSSVPPIGVSTLMPPHIQGAERRTERRARVTGSRWALRVLVVGGLAGAAWLLTGAAAQAADRDVEPSGSLIGSVLHGDATAPVTGLLQAAAQPLETARPAHRHHAVVTDVLDVPRRVVLSRPVRTLDKITHGTTGTTVDAAIDGVDEVLRELAGPLRLTGGPTVTQQLLDPAPRPVAKHVTRIPQPAAKAVPADDRDLHEADAPRQEVPQAAPAVRVSSIAIIKARRASGVGSHAAVPVKHVRAAFAPSAHRHRAATSVAPTPATVVNETPGGDGPAAPLQLHLGDVSGTPASGSGAPTEGGSAAFLPAAIADSTMACHLLPIASDVEVRRHDAEAPTVSPD